jgi:hypothetical protein
MTEELREPLNAFLDEHGSIIPEDVVKDFNAAYERMTERSRRFVENFWNAYVKFDEIQNDAVAEIIDWKGMVAVGPSKVEASGALLDLALQSLGQIGDAVLAERELSDWVAIKSVFRIQRPERTFLFLEHHPTLAPILLEARERIGRNVSLTAHPMLYLEPSDKQLKVVVSTTDDVEKATAADDRIHHGWYYDLAVEERRSLLIVIQHVLPD